MNDIILKQTKYILKDLLELTYDAEWITIIDDKGQKIIDGYSWEIYETEMVELEVFSLSSECVDGLVMGIIFDGETQYVIDESLEEIRLNRMVEETNVEWE